MTIYISEIENHSNTPHTLYIKYQKQMRGKVYYGKRTLRKKDQWPS